MKFATLVAFLAFAPAAFAQMPPLVNPVTVAISATVHITPVDQNGNPIPVGECVLSTVGVSPPLASTVATTATDSTGFNFTGVASGSGFETIKCTSGSASVISAPFAVTVPWNVTAVGSTSP